MQFSRYSFFKRYFDYFVSHFHSVSCYHILMMGVCCEGSNGVKGDF